MGDRVPTFPSVSGEVYLHEGPRGPARSKRKLGGSRASDRSVAGWFRLQAFEMPERVAVVHGGEYITYGDLEARSNRLAHLLRSVGVGAESVVGLRMTRSPEFVVAAMGIWKAGGAYLPIDPDVPAERASFVLKDAGAMVLLTEEKLAGQALTLEGERQVIVVDREAERLSALPLTGPDVLLGAENLAYVIYTSGSTGTPKGVEVTHKNLLNLIAWHQETFRITAKDRATQLAGLGFDAAVWEIWPYLTAGASLHFVPELVRTAPEQLRDWLIENEISVSFVPTTLAECLLSFDWPEKTPLRLMLTGADTLHRYPSAQIPFEFVNNYGPTECTVVTTSGVVPRETDAKGLPSIGRAIANVRTYVLDENLCQVADGQPGELYVGGVGVARGYRNRPELTKERFIENPLNSGQDARLYKTGDLVCAMPDGQIAFLGRTDEQIKIAGYRIEPNEIVQALQKSEAIQASCVIAREDRPNHKRLVAYIVKKADGTVTATDLRALLQEKLPSYMIPAEFVVLERVPLTPNGKIDRAALPAPDASNVLGDTAFVAPRNAIEQRMAEMLSKLLRLERVSVEDNFFMLGGHSLLGTQLIGRVRDAFGVELSLRTVFDASTIAQLSVEIEKLLLAKLDSLSEEEAQQLLDAMEQDSLLENEKAQ